MKKLFLLLVVTGACVNFAHAGGKAWWLGAAADFTSMDMEIRGVFSRKFSVSSQTYGLKIGMSVGSRGRGLIETGLMFRNFDYGFDYDQINDRVYYKGIYLQYPFTYHYNFGLVPGRLLLSPSIGIGVLVNIDRRPLDLKTEEDDAENFEDFMKNFLPDISARLEFGLSLNYLPWPRHKFSAGINYYRHFKPVVDVSVQSTGFRLKSAEDYLGFSVKYSFRLNKPK